MENVKLRLWEMVLRELVSAWHHLILVRGSADATTTCFCWSWPVSTDQFLHKECQINGFWPVGLSWYFQVFKL